MFSEKLLTSVFVVAFWTQLEIALNMEVSVIVDVTLEIWTQPIIVH